MDVITLDPTTYLPEQMVEGYSSMIWTERHVDASEFQMKSSRVEEMKARLPEGSYISLRDSNEVMEVETHSEGINDAGIAELTIKGRSFVNCFERRYIAGDYGVGWEMLQEYTAQDAMLVLLFNAVNNPTVVDLTGSPNAHDPADYLPGTVITKSITVITPPGEPVNGEIDLSDLQTTKVWALQSGQVYPKVLDLLSLSELGLRMIRPPTHALYGVYVQADGTFAPIKMSDGSLRFDVYNGRNRTITPSEVDPLEPVIFRYDAGHVVAPNFLSSIKDYMNFAHVSSSFGDVDVWVDGPVELVGTTGSTDIWQMQPLEGRERRSLFVDAGNLDDSMLSDPNAALRQIGYSALKQAKRLKMMEAAVSLDTPYSYGVHYGLGDYVTMVGGPGFIQNMQVIEYVRTEDETGETGYPTLIQKEPPSPITPTD